MSILFLFAGLIHAQTHPDFSGSWVLFKQSCHPEEKTRRSLQMIIDHHEADLRVTIKSPLNGTVQQLTLPYRTTGEELHYTGLDSDDFRSKLHWQGSSLIFNTVERERGSKIHAQEVWKLQDQGTKLFQSKTENGPQEHSTCTTVFNKVAANNEAQKVKITLKSDRVAVDINGKPFTSLYMGATANKPFLFPVITASGKKVTRGYPVEPLPADPTDHPHQKGLWVGAEHLSDMDFWENDPSYHRPNMGRVVFKDVLETHIEPDRGSFTTLSDWVSQQGESVVAETRKMTFYAEPADYRMFDVELELKAKRKVTFQDHHDAVIGIRLAPAFDEKNGGRPVNAQGLAGEAQVRGQRSEWVDWKAMLDGEQVGVTLMDHPANYSWPTRWHVRSMGLLVASPFAQHDYDSAALDNSKTLNSGDVLHLRYRVLIHPMTTNVAALYQEFASQAMQAPAM